MSATGRLSSLIARLTAALVTLALLAVLGVSSSGAAGNVITSPDTTGLVGSFTSLVLDGNGNPVVSYYDATNGRLKVLHCGDTDCSAGNVITSPDTFKFVGIFTSLALDSSGNPVVSYTGLGELKVLHCGNPSCSAGNVITVPDPAFGVGDYTSLVLDGSGNPVVSYHDGFPNYDLKVLHCGDPNCTSGNIITSPDTTGVVGIFTSLVLDGSGNPVVSYYDATNQNLKVLHCGDTNCSAGNVITSPDTVSNVGAVPFYSQTSLALDGAGNPVVSYTDRANRDLKVLHCGDPNCGAGNVITSPDTVGDVGSHASLVLDSRGNPVVSYRGNSLLKLLHCGNANCSAGNVITSPDVTSVSYTSLVLDGSGNPVVSYRGNSDLKVLHCGNPNCSAVSCADLDGDGKVTGRDVAIVARALPSQPGHKRWNPDADLNHDHVADLGDLNSVLASLHDPDCSGP